MHVAAASCRWNSLRLEAAATSRFTRSAMLGICSDRVKQKFEIILPGLFRRNGLRGKGWIIGDPAGFSITGRGETPWETRNGGTRWRAACPNIRDPPVPEGRQVVATGVSPWNPTGHVQPRRGERGWLHVPTGSAAPAGADTPPAGRSTGSRPRLPSIAPSGAAAPPPEFPGTPMRTIIGRAQSLAGIPASLTINFPQTSTR